jgi:hypothetical protein
MRNRVTLLAAATVMGTIGGPACAQLGSDVPTDSQLLTQRVQEAGSTASGIFDIPALPQERCYSLSNDLRRALNLGRSARFRWG